MLREDGSQEKPGPAATGVCLGAPCCADAYPACCRAAVLQVLLSVLACDASPCRAAGKKQKTWAGSQLGDELSSAPSWLWK